MKDILWTIDFVNEMRQAFAGIAKHGIGQVGEDDDEKTATLTMGEGRGIQLQADAFWVRMYLGSGMDPVLLCSRAHGEKEVTAELRAMVESARVFATPTQVGDLASQIAGRFHGGKYAHSGSRMREIEAAFDALASLGYRMTKIVGLTTVTLPGKGEIQFQVLADRVVILEGKVQTEATDEEILRKIESLSRKEP